MNFINKALIMTKEYNYFDSSIHVRHGKIDTVT